MNQIVCSWCCYIHDEEDVDIENCSGECPCCGLYDVEIFENLFELWRGEP